MATLKLAVTDFGQKNIPTGDIDERSALGQVAPELGAEIHREIQTKRHDEVSSYQSEVAVEYVVPHSEDLLITISGRMDGTWTEDDVVVIEEIKSTLNVRKTISQMINDPEHPYILQVKLYAWITWRQTGVVPKTHILVVAAASRDTTVFPVDFDPDDFSAWINKRVSWIAATWAEVQEFKQTRKSIQRNLKFPFAKKREGQRAMLDDVALACKEKRQLLAQAPTGLGKTAAVIFPMLKTVCGAAINYFMSLQRTVSCGRQRNFW